MYNLLIKNRKLYDFINYKEPEVKISFVIVILFDLILYKIELYENIGVYVSDIKDIFLCICGGFIGIIGFALSGIAILSTMFTKKQIDLIEKQNGIGTIEKIMSSFSFLSLSIAVSLFFLILINFLLTSRYKIPEKVIFFIIVSIVIYIVAFNIFYTVSLVTNCISLFSIRKIYDRFQEKDFFDMANEIRIDMILKTFLDINNISREEFMNNIEIAVNESKYEEKEELLDYFYKFYTGKTKDNL